MEDLGVFGAIFGAIGEESALDRYGAEGMRGEMMRRMWLALGGLAPWEVRSP